MPYIVSIIITGAVPAEGLCHLHDLILDIVGRRNLLFNGIVQKEPDTDELGDKSAMKTPL